MNFFLWFTILAGFGCIMYTLVVYIKIRKVSHSQNKSVDISITEDHLKLRYKHAELCGYCEYGVSGEEFNRRYTIKFIQLKLVSGPASLDQWNKDDLYEIERQLLIRYPDITVNWAPPMKHLLP